MYDVAYYFFFQIEVKKTSESMATVVGRLSRHLICVLICFIDIPLVSIWAMRRQAVFFNTHMFNPLLQFSAERTLQLYCWKRTTCPNCYLRFGMLALFRVSKYVLQFMSSTSPQRKSPPNRFSADTEHNNRCNVIR